MIKHTSYLQEVKINNLVKINRLLPLLMFTLLSTLITTEGISQALSCHGQINVSLNSDCEFEVTPEVLSSAALGGCVDGYTVMLTAKKAITGNTVDYNNLGELITAKLIDNCTSNTCWGLILVEDKTPPTIVCDDMIEISCLEMDSYLPTITDCDASAFLVQVGQTITLGDCEGPDSDVIKTISRTYVGEDASGNRSEPCTQVIKLLRIDTLNFVNPPDFIDMDDDMINNSFVCGTDYPVDAEGHPSPDTTGIPYLAFPSIDMQDTLLPLFPAIDDACKARLEYTDFVIGKDGCLTKIMREWSYIDACSQYDQIYIHTQTIWIRDTQAPQLVCSHPITTVGTPLPNSSQNAHGWGVGNANCEFVVNIPPVTGTDNCSGIVRYEVLIDSVLVLTQNGGSINLPADTFELMYVGFDGCGTPDTCVTDLIVLDATPPVAVCDRHSVIGLTSDGTVEVQAFVFDDGSFDDCGLNKMEIRRMGDATNVCDTQDLHFGPTVTFCCADVGIENMVEFRVYDFGGRYNSCMVSVEIQDKTGPSVDCPASVSVNCDHPIDLTNLSAEFGSASANNQCETTLTEGDPVVDLDSCNKGTITRSWSVSDIGGTDDCIQVITVENPFDFSFENLDSILLRPQDIDTTGACGIDILPGNLPEGSQRPVLLGSPCDLLGASYTDEEFVFDDGSGACLKIIRNWTIINWCADEDENRLEVAQIIKVNNTQGPEVTLGDNQDEICTFDNDCQDGPITLTASAVDDCSEDLRTVFFLDAFNDGIIDDTINLASTVGTGSFTVEKLGQTTQVTVTGNYPIGTHRGIFTFIDQCNNVTSKDHVFTIKNCKAPTCAFIDGLRISLQVMDTDGDGTPDNEMACVWASDFDASSVSACGGDLEFFFDEDRTMPERCFTCCEEGRNLVDIYVFDQFGNHSFCTTSVTIDDHNDVNFCRLTASCPDADVMVRDCGAGAVLPSVLGQPTIGDGCSCDNLDRPFSDVTTTTDDGCSLITRTWQVSCDGDFVDECVQRITVRNVTPPQLVDCPGHITMNLGGSSACEAFINIRQPSVVDGCNDNVTVSHDSPFADMQGLNASGTYPVGTTSVTYTATNGCNISSTCTLTVTIRDNNPPVCNPRDITVNILSDGEVTVGPGQLDNGSDDSCGDVFVAGSNMTFFCEDAGTTQPVTYFIEDESGNRIQCSANVTINDVSEPVCNTRNRTVRLGDDGTVTINSATLYDGGAGNCGAFDVNGTTTTYDCNDAGTSRSVTYTISTPGGGSINCSGTVTILDVDRPECDARNITVSLGTNGQVVVDPTTLHQGATSGGVCGEINITGTPVTFDCCDAGSTRTVTYQINGTLNCDAQVTINQEAAPVCNSNDITVSLDDDGTFSVNPQSLYLGTEGLCFSVGGPTNAVFDCDDAGTTQQVTYTLIPSCSDDQVVNCTANVTINPEGQAQCNAQDITVSLGANGTVTVDPTTLQSGGGSGVCGDGGNVTGTPVTYDCCDAGEDRTITYMINGTLTCSATVTITPEAAPVCNSEDITVSINARGFVVVNTETLYAGTIGTCFSITGNTLRFECEDAGTTQTGTYTLVSTCDGMGIDCEANIVINPVEDIMLTCPADQTVDCGTDVSDLSVFGTATAADGCGGGAITPEETVVTNLGACNMGVITRTFVATNDTGGSEVCRQIITVSGPANPVTEADITWPTSPFSVTGCDGDAPADGRPIVNTSNAECSSISMSSVDSRLIVNANTSCAGNVVRTWTVIDSCQVDGAGNGIFTFDQVFEFTDIVDPELTLPADITVNAASDNCEAVVSVPLVTATDDCDANPVITNDSPFADTNGNNLSGTYPVGIHVVNVTVTDACGNTTTSSITITVNGSAVGFSFECKKRILSIDENQQVVLHIDSIVCLTQACEGTYSASFSRTDVNQTVVVFGCNDVGTLDGFMSYVYLNGVLFDSCTTFQIVNDQFGNCSSPLNQSDISGFIRTESGQGLAATQIELDGSEFPVLATDEDGFYAFPPVVNGGSYELIPEKNDDHLNGVSTLDIIMIQKHILGLELLDSPYKLIAADINNSKSVSVADIAELRKLILGIYDELPSNTSWKTIDADYEFANDANPFEALLPESYDIINLSGDMDIDFVGLKVGDVNQSASPVELVTSEVRSNDNLTFQVTPQLLANGMTAYEFRAANYENIEGFQFTLQMGDQNSYEGIEPGSLNIVDDNVGLRYESRGLITVSFNELSARSSDENEILFTVFINENSSSIEPISISSSITNAEAYGTDIFGIDLELESSDLLRVTELSQNNPNPWSAETSIDFTLPEAMTASITVYDIGGRVLYRLQQPFKKGINTISLDKDDIGGYSGVAFYEMISKDIKLIKSMIVIE